MSLPIFVLNGPNLNMLGKREPGIYGGATLENIRQMCEEAGQRVGRAVDFRQTNHEGVLVDWIQESMTAAAGIVINPGAYTHTSVAVHDAIRAAGRPVIEVHISNIFAREAFRHHSYVSPLASGVLCGFGPHGYVMGIEALARMINA
jgi:3-dehydroquinate dehydratase II